MNLRDLNQTQEAGKVHAGLVLLLFFFFQKFSSVQMDSICTDSLPARSFGEVHGISTWILHSSAGLMWLDPNSLKLVYLEMVFTTRHPPTLGCVSITSPTPGAGGNRLQLPLRATTTFLLLTCGFRRHFIKARKGERMQRDHHSRKRLGENPGYQKVFAI